MAKPTNCGPKSLGWPMVPIHHYLCGGLSVVSRALICVFGFSCSAYFALFFSQNKSNLKCTCNIFVSQQTYYTNLPISAKRRRKPAIQQTALWINKSSRRANHAQERPRQSPNNSCAGNRRAKGMHMLLCRVDIYVYGASTTVSPRRLFSLSHLQNSSEAIYASSGIPIPSSVPASAPHRGVRYAATMRFLACLLQGKRHGDASDQLADGRKQLQEEESSKITFRA